MFSPNRQRPSRPTSEKKPLTADAKKKFWAVLGMSLALLVIYYGIPAIRPELTQAVLIVYMVAFAGFLVTYIAYNRGFVNKDVTVDMLPDDWSEEKKQEFVEGNRRRAEKSS